MSVQATMTAEDRALERAKAWNEVTWHVASYAIVNILLLSMDIAQGGGLDWAFWPALGWGFAVAFHVAHYVMDVSGQEGRKFQQFLAEERAKEISDFQVKAESGSR